MSRWSCSTGFHILKAELEKLAAPSDPRTLGELEQEFGLSESTWRQLLHRDHIKGTKIGTTGPSSTRTR